MAPRRKVEPVLLTLTFQTAVPEPNQSVTSYVDLSQCASLAARKFMRQGLNWGFGGIKCAAQSAGTISVYKLPNSWVMANSWVKSYNAWQDLNNAALAESQSLRPRFLDFKVYADAEHHAAGIPANLLPITAPPAVTLPGEWEASKFNIPRTDSTTGVIAPREIIAVGPNYPGAGASGLNAVSMIEGYAASRLLPSIRDPNAPDDAADASGVAPQNWLAALANEGLEQTEEVIEDMITENNIAPYPFENDGVNLDTMYPGGANQMSGLEWHDFAQIFSTSATTNVGITRIKAGNLPCGLLKIVWTPEAGTDNLIFQIDMIPGPHNGYLAQPMQEMN